MISDHPAFQAPLDTRIPLWRYMDLSKFVSLLQTRNLYLSRADNLGDPFEGSSSVSDVDFRDQLLTDIKLRKLYFGDTKLGIKDIRRINKITPKVHEFQLRKVFVSCWHASWYESAAMWSTYAKGGEAVAIQTTFERLAEELPSVVGMGQVHYRDYAKDSVPTNVYERFLSKRRSFEHEKEVRAIIWSSDEAFVDGKSADGRVYVDANAAQVAIDLTALIERVYVGPTAQPWFLEVVRGLVLRYDLAGRP